MSEPSWARARRAVEDEARKVGRACALVHYAEMGEVLAIVYDVAPSDIEVDGAVAHERRAALYVNDRPQTSVVVGTRWLPAEREANTR